MIVLTVLKIILIVLLGIVALCGVLLTVPVSARVTGDRSLRESGGTRTAGATRSVQGPQGPGDTPSTRGTRVDFVWLFGAVRIPLRRKPGSSTRGEGGTTGGKKGRGDRGDRAGASGKGLSLAAADIPRIARVVVTFLRRLLGRFVVTADGDLYAGLDDPADTGILWGEVYTLVQALHRRTGLRVHPVFDGGTLAFVGTAAIRVVPITLLFPVISVALSRDG
ncbi:MAG: hypothetical protein ACOC2V_02445, partial [Alkalispirochaeta sp.]